QEWVMTFFELQNVGKRYGTVEVLRSIGLNLKSGEFVAIAGPNGAGKSTLVSVLAGLMTPSTGECRFMGREMKAWSRRDFARRVAVILQEGAAGFPFTAEDVVYMGRLPHRSGLYETSGDRAAVEEALEQTGTAEFREREFRTLSGGEKQRVLLASALAQRPEVLLLDEPSAHLDIYHQVQLYRLLRELSTRGLLVISVTHDLNVALRYADRLLLMHRGHIRADGQPVDVVRADLMEEVYSVPIEVHRNGAGKPWITYGA
ncbi:MAG: heme ABC transporter ATP-binding protein, partial [Bryobacteraceae bacterium]